MSELIIVTPETQAVALFEKENFKNVLTKIENAVSEFVPDLSTATSRKEIASMAHKVSRSKTFIDQKGKELTEDWRKSIGVINDQRNEAKERLDRLKAIVRKPLTEYENKIKEEEEIFNQKKMKMESQGNRLSLLVLSSSEIKEILNNLESEKLNPDMESFIEKTGSLIDETISSCKSCLDEVIKKEEEAIELKRLREESNARKIKDHEEKMKKEAAEKATREAEQKAAAEKAEIEAEKEKLKKEKEESDRRAAEYKAKVEQDKKDAEQKAEREKQEAIQEEKRKQEEERLRREEQEKEAKRLEEERVANETHRKQIESDAQHDLESLINSLSSEMSVEELSQNIIIAISHNDISNLTINY